ncbi:MAG: tRNA pseudouridine38-40 synthase [Lentimonas sp.]|jgi:tRNA pseudouridine38-40 synthase
MKQLEMRRYKLTIEYYGTGLVGWQRQPDFSNSAQQIIEDAIFKLTQTKVKIHASGRTDAGVHALGQVAHFDLEKDKSTKVMQSGLNHFLRKSNCAILNCEIVNDDFHSRFDAKSRSYQYQIINRHPHLTFNRNLAWQIHNPLDITKMREAAQFLIGTHDFTSFRDSACQAKTAIRTVEKIEIIKEGELIKMNFLAKSFLHHQVRNMVGTIVLAGKGKIEPGKMKEILEVKDRKKSGENAPPWGLYFIKVNY